MSRRVDTKMELFRLSQVGNLQLLKSFITANFTDKNWLGFHHNKSGDTVLHLCARCGHLSVLRWLSEKQAADLEQANLDAKRPLHETAQYSHLSCLRYLIDRGVTVDALKRADWTPLMLACTKRHVDVIRALLAAGANPQLCNKDGWNSFHIACREGCVEVITLLLDENPDIWNSISKNGRTPLHTAALHGCVEVLEILLDRCAFQSDARDSCGTTPLMDALRAGHSRTAQLLVDKHKACVSTEDSVGRQALHLAAQAGSVVSVHYLLDVLGVDVNMKSSVSGVTPLHVAAKEGQDSMVELLLGQGADVDAVDTKGRTALHIACGNQYVNCVCILLKHGARDMQDHTGNYASALVVVQTIRDLMESHRR